MRGNKFPEVAVGNGFGRLTKSPPCLKGGVCAADGGIHFMFFATKTTECSENKKASTVWRSLFLLYYFKNFLNVKIHRSVNFNMLFANRPLKTAPEHFNFFFRNRKIVRAVFAGSVGKALFEHR